MSNTARIFEDVGGYYVCDDELPYLDTRGHAHTSKASALRAAYEAGYVRAIGSGAYKQRAKIEHQINTSSLRVYA